MKMTFAHTVLKTDEGTFRAGDVIRSTHDESPWCQCIILGFSEPKKHRDDVYVYVKLARPFAYASGVGTTCPNVLMGVEEFEMNADRLKYEKVLSRNGNSPMISGHNGHRKPFEGEVIDLRTDDDCACPGCGCKPGEGRTPGCNHPDGCGYLEA